MPIYRINFNKLFDFIGFFQCITRKLKYTIPLAGNLCLSLKPITDLARTLHYDYRSSNGQIRRVLGLGQYEVDSLFPKGE